MQKVLTPADPSPSNQISERIWLVLPEMKAATDREVKGNQTTFKTDLERNNFVEFHYQPPKV